MPPKENTVLRYMSERLKHEPYIDNPDSKVFLSEVAMVIMHILQKDGKIDLQIDNCLEEFKDYIFNFSIKKIAATRNLAYFTDKDDASMSVVFRKMLEDFSKKKICTLMLLFNEVEAVDDNFIIIFKKKPAIATEDNAPTNAVSTTKEVRTKDEITLNNQEIVPLPHFYGEDVADSKLTDLLDSSEIKILEENTLVQEINALLFSLAWKNVYDLFGDVLCILYNQQRLAENKNKIINYYILIEFESKLDSFFKTHKKKINLTNRQSVRNSFRDIWFKEYSESTIIKMAAVFDVIESITKGGDITIKDPQKVIPNYFESASSPLSNVKNEQFPVVSEDNSLLNQLIIQYNESNHAIINESAIIDLHKRLITNKKWNNIVDCISSIAYIIIKQSFLANTQGGLTLSKLKYLFLDCIFLMNQDAINFNNDNHEKNREQIRFKLQQQYGIKRLIGCYYSIIGLFKVEDNGTINYKESINKFEENKTENDNQEQTVIIDKTNPVKGNNEVETGSVEKGEQEVIIAPSEITIPYNTDSLQSTQQSMSIIDGHDDNILIEQYNNSDRFIINEKNIIVLHKELALNGEWSNVSQCIASIAYIIIRQIELANRPRGLSYKMLKKLSRECMVIKEQDNLTFEDGQHGNNIEKVNERLIQRYGIKALINYYRLILGLANFDDDGTILANTNNSTPNYLEESISEKQDDLEVDSTEGSEIEPKVAELPNDDTFVQTETDDDSDENDDGNIEMEKHDKRSREPVTEIPVFINDEPPRAKVFSDNEDDLSTSLLQFYNYLKNSELTKVDNVDFAIKEVFKYYYLDIKECFSHIRTKGELFEAYQHFKDYSAINFISKRHREDLMEAFRYYIYYLLEVNIKQLH